MAKFWLSTVAAVISVMAGCGIAVAAQPTVGERVPDFTLSNVQGKQVKFSEVLGSGPVVLVALRGYPGYQCPFCTKQVHDFVLHEKDFAAAAARVVFVYPGPAEDLGARANEFLKDAKFPDSYQMLLDPGYSFTNAYGLRWEGKNETAYPSTFVLDRSGAVVWETTGKTHGGRASAATVLDVLPKK